MKNLRKEIPKKGQFVLVWHYEGEVWSDAFKWIDEKLYVYDNHKFVECFYPICPVLYWDEPDGQNLVKVVTKEDVIRTYVS